MTNEEVLEDLRQELSHFLLTELVAEFDRGYYLNILDKITEQGVCWLEVLDKYPTGGVRDSSRIEVEQEAIRKRIELLQMRSRVLSSYRLLHPSAPL